jgi:hypothetical protein
VRKIFCMKKKSTFLIFRRERCAKNIKMKRDLSKDRPCS